MGFLEEFQDKILFGTDVCFADEQGRIPQLGWLKELRGKGRLSETAFEKIVSGNGLRLLGMG